MIDGYSPENKPKNIITIIILGAYAVMIIEMKSRTAPTNATSRLVKTTPKPLPKAAVIKISHKNIMSGL